MSRLQYEKDAWSKGYKHVLFLDEAGRGCLMGPVSVAGVIYPFQSTEEILPKARDSKALSKKRREKLYDEILESALATKIVLGSPQDIDKYNILQCTLRCMMEIVQTIEPTPDYVYIDGNCTLPIPNCTAVPKLDDLSVSCASASILAKTFRDRHVENLVHEHVELEKYGIVKNKGYPTKDHRQALATHGSTPFHRQSFKWKIPS